VIQRASERALRHGYRMDDYLEVIGRIRQRSRVPLLLFSYYNPLLQYGLEKLADRARRAGLDAVLTTDLTPEEAGPFCRAFRQEGLLTEDARNVCKALLRGRQIQRPPRRLTSAFCTTQEHATRLAVP